MPDTSRLRAARLLFLAAVLLPVSNVRAQLLHDILDRTIPTETGSVVVAGKTARHALVSGEIDAPFTGLAVELRAETADLQATVRFETPAGWSLPETMHLVRSATSDALVAGWRTEAESTARRFEINVDVPVGVEVSFGAAGVFDNRNDIDAAPPIETQLRPLAASSTGSVSPPPLITRDEWGAEPFRGTPVPLAAPSYDYMTFHHAAGYSADNKTDGLAQMRAIQDLHQNVRGWSDIGYQFLIDRAGNLYQGRPFLTQATSLEDLPVLALGAHAGGANTGNIGICLLGCYHPPEGSYCEQQITPEAYETYITVFAFLSERYGVSPSQIRGHRDFGQTSCPGENNYVLLPQIRQDVADLVVTGNATIGEAAMTAEVDAGGVVNLSLTLLADYGIAGYRLERWIDFERAVLFNVEGELPTHWADGGLTEPTFVQYRLFALGEDGRRQLLTSVTVDFDEDAAYALADAFPNPADTDLRIRYWLRELGEVHLVLYDALGRQIAVLAEGYRDGGTWNVAQWPASSLAPGVYSYRLRVEGFSGVSYDRSRSVVVVH